jgi:hypothetical protein
MRAGLGNYIHLVWTVIWTVPSPFFSPDCEQLGVDAPR